ncbi:NAD-dependent alcohol dehydrogenase [Thalassobaculum fulvum]|jgi:D-arabinose 1-dehydrogenase-like Zn-dependent alcohol dehydrogenase|uniref:alcohol dehydrogenase n=1 Tax=Thalassobaculum fulvum TaxID=1633335 RepID=A0A918XUX8_9PROT|nr:alcohol dehydrogenase [Thalassobaculum fulvum]GHD58241.1 NAD-dependent alcohol dehydrogenase [Thalassobaculum fulvum]
MRSYQLMEPGKPFEAVDKPDPTPTGTEVLLKVTRAGVCHSDIHISDGYFDLGGGKVLNIVDRGQKFPITLGHEVLGEVVALGPDAKGVKVGQTMLVHPWLGCGECSACKAEQENLCPTMRSIGIFRDGGYATHCMVPNPKYLVDIGDVDPTVATPYSCSGVTVYSALKKAMPLRDDEWLAIMGAGGLGLSAVAIAKAMGVKNVISVDIDDSHLEAAKGMGASAVLNPKTAGNAVAELQKLAGGELRAVVDTVGGEATANLGMAALRKGGRYVIVGLYGGQVTISLPTIPMRALSILGSYVGSLGELKELMELVKTGKVKPIPIETRPVEQAYQTLQDLKAGKIVGRVVLTND